MLTLRTVVKGDLERVIVKRQRDRRVVLKGDIAVPTALHAAVDRISQRDLIRELFHG